MKLGRFYFGYNAVTDKGRRTAPKTRTMHESEVLTANKRKKLQATAQDQIRNHSLVAWMVRKHLDYVSKFHFSFRTEYQELNDLVNRIFRWHGAPRNLDFMRRFGRDEMFRMFEVEKVLSGDAGLLKLNDMTLQALESDLIAKGTGAPDTVNDSGLVVDEYGRVDGFAICERAQNGGKPIFKRVESADDVIFDGYWTRFSSQFRGVSPLSTAINMVQDIHEGFDYNLIKAKMHALFGIAIQREAQGVDGMGDASGQGSVAEWEAQAYTWTAGDYCVYNGKMYYCNTTHTTTTASVFATDLSAGKWTADTESTGLDLNPSTINILDMEPGSKVETIESGTPSSEFVEGSYLFIQIAMLALDIPVTCFDSRRSSFSARIADLNEYEVSCDSKRTKNRYVRQDYSDWVLSTIWNDPNTAWPLREVAGRNQMDLRALQEKVEWVPSGSPWLDKLKQLKGDELGINIGLDNPIDAARRRGKDVFENLEKTKQVLDHAKKLGVPIVFGSKSDKTIADYVREEIEDQGGGQDDG